MLQWKYPLPARKTKLFTVFGAALASRPMVNVPVVVTTVAV